MRCCEESELGDPENARLVSLLAPALECSMPRLSVVCPGAVGDLGDPHRHNRTRNLALTTHRGSRLVDELLVHMLSKRGSAGVSEAGVSVAAKPSNGPLWAVK